MIEIIEETFDPPAGQRGNGWSDRENDTIVAHYFSMLADDLAGRPHRKAETNRLVQAATGRTHASIEYKNRNISAVLKGLGEVFLPGYTPAFSYQASLVSAVVRGLDENSSRPPFHSPSEIGRSNATPTDATLCVGVPPARGDASSSRELEQLTVLAQNFDVAGRDARNRALGYAGEERVLAHERSVLLAAGRADLADRIRWVSHVDGDGAGYDISSFSHDGSPRLIEVKTTNGWERTPFALTRNELAVAKERSSEWLIMRLWDFSRIPKAFELRPPLEAYVSLVPLTYQAAFS